MPRPVKSLSISDLEGLLQQQRVRRQELQQERRELERKIARIDQEIASLDGKPGAAPAGFKDGRSPNGKSLVATLEEVLSKKPEGLSISQMIDAARDVGYVSTSPNFRSIINQALIKEKKRFIKLSRGIYTVKGAK